MRGLATLGAVAVLLASIGTAAADDWVAVKLRGHVLQLVDGEWQPLERGGVVPDSRVIRTMGGGRVTFVRGEETLELGGNTQIQIHDRGGNKPFTTVKQYFGSVQVEAEVKQVQHFAVQTPHLVAVVKGTKFTVVSGKTESEVEVKRGAVSVADKEGGSHTTVLAGQSAEVQSGGGMEVAGRGELPPVLDAKGKPVEPKEKPGKGNAETDEHPAGGKDKPGSGGPGEDKGSSGGKDKPGKDDGGPVGSDNSGSGDANNSGPGSGNSDNDGSGSGNSDGGGRGSGHGKH